MHSVAYTGGVSRQPVHAHRTTVDLGEVKIECLPKEILQ